jgi:uncharacterized membrane protein YgcG
LARIGLVLVGTLSGCGQSDEGKREARSTEQARPTTSGRIVDQAGVLSPADEARLTTMAEKVAAAHGRQVLVLTVPPLGRESLEHFGWAVTGQRRDGGPVLLMIRPDDRSLRIEAGGALEPRQAAAVASVMRSSLQAEGLADAIKHGLRRLDTELRESVAA